MTPAEVADALDHAAEDAAKIAHDIRQKRSPGYSDTPVDLTEVEIARIKALAELLTPVMTQVMPPLMAPPIASVPPPAPGTQPPVTT